MLSDDAKRQTSVEQLQVFFSPDSDAAFEIARGKKREDGCYTFPVTLFGGGGLRPHHARVVLRKLAKNDWTVDRIP